jgi:hypothetical protein
MPFDRKIYFEAMRDSFGGSYSQQQVDGQEAILSGWEAGRERLGEDMRFLAYELATTKHETAATMSPIEEYGRGEGQPYGKQDPETGQKYFGRGFVQLTWRENYRKATVELHLSGQRDLEWHAQHALDMDIAAGVMFRGMTEGWFRPPNKLSMFFSASMDDPYEAREIINGDKHIVPSWSNGVNIGNLIAGYYYEFLSALRASAVNAVPGPGPRLEPRVVSITIDAPPGVVVLVNGITIPQPAA